MTPARGATSEGMEPAAGRSGSSAIDRSLQGEQLYGDDFPPDQIEAWFRDEEEAYFRLRGTGPARWEYEYRALNWEHGYRFLESREFRSVLGIGSAIGGELIPVARRSRRITILEPAGGFVVPDVDGTPVTYVAPRAGGAWPFPGASFDLVTCFGVLHHIPNVSGTVRELARCLAPRGYALVREPIVSMGDWRFPRRGLTRRERGIPLAIFRRIIQAAGLSIVRERRCMFSLTARLRPVFGKPVYNSRPAVLMDGLVCRLPVWSTKYHPAHWWDKLRPTCVFYVLQKPVERA
jgi:SAM-dependent methyltransferase